MALNTATLVAMLRLWLLMTRSLILAKAAEALLILLSTSELTEQSADMMAPRYTNWLVTFSSVVYVNILGISGGS